MLFQLSYASFSGRPQDCDKSHAIHGTPPDLGGARARKRRPAGRDARHGPQPARAGGCSWTLRWPNRIPPALPRRIEGLALALERTPPLRVRAAARARRAERATGSAGCTGAPWSARRSSRSPPPPATDQGRSIRVIVITRARVAPLCAIRLATATAFTHWWPGPLGMCDG